MSQRGPAARVVILTVVQFALAGLALQATLRLGHPTATGPVAIGFVALLAALVLAESATADITIRDQVVSVSVGEIVAAVALVMAAPQTYVVARATSGLLTQLRRTKSAPRLAFNTALFSLDAAVAVLTFGLLGAADPTAPAAWLASIAAIAAGQAASAVAISAVISATSGSSGARAALQTFRLMAPFMLAGAAAGTAAAQLALTDRAGLWFAAVVGISWWSVLRVLGFMGQRYATLRAFHHHTAILQQATETQEVAAATTTAIHALIGSTYAEVNATTLLAPSGSVRNALNGWDPQGVDRALLDAPSVTADERRARDVRTAIVEPMHDADGEPMGYLLAGWQAPPRRLDDSRQTLATIARQAEATFARVRVTATLRHELEQKAHRSLHDELTGLPNRAHLTLRLQQHLDGIRRSDTGVALILIDIDRFRAINDTLGHVAGDAVLLEIGERLRATSRAHDLVARFGSDEFAVYATDVTDEVEAVQLAARIRAELCRVLEHDDLRLDMTVTVGVAMASDGLAETTIRRADAALHRAKAAEEPIRLHGGDDEGARRRLAIAAELRDAAPSGRVEAWFQPKVTLADGRVAGVEALARWTDDDLGVITPGEFIPIAEQTGAIVALTHSILAQSIERLRAWQAHGLDLSVSVNVSPRVLLEADFADEVAAMLRREGVAADRLVIEVTESLFVAGSRATAGLEALRALGVRISIDDYGTGYSSLNYLHRLAAHEVKIDRSFLLGIHDDAARRLIVASTIDLAHGLGMTVVAEGVEDVETRDLLAAMGCDEMQGFLAASAMRPDEVLGWVSGLPSGRWSPREVAT